MRGIIEAARRRHVMQTAALPEFTHPRPEYFTSGILDQQILHDYFRAHADTASIQLVGPLAEAGLELSEPVIFVDGGARLRRGAEGIAVGDGDSFSGELDHLLDTAKDFSDLAFALSLVPEGFNEIELHGFLGGRRDHELLNLGECHHFLTRRTQSTRLRLDNTLEAFSAGHWRFHRQGLFSLVTFAPALVALSGDCRYPIPPGTTVQPVSSFGLSNEGHGEIRLEADGPVFIIRTAGEGD